MYKDFYACMSEISIHTFLAEGDTKQKQPAPIKKISIHTFLAEGDF